MTSTPTLAGKWALVTGCSRGIGAAIVRRLACQEATVAVNYRSDRAAADGTRRRTDRPGWAASAFPGDAQARRGADPRVGRRGGIGVRRLGPVGQQRRRSSTSTLETITQADFDLLFQTNVAGQLLVTQALSGLVTVESSSLLNIKSLGEAVTRLVIKPHNSSQNKQIAVSPGVFHMMIRIQPPPQAATSP